MRTRGEITRVAGEAVMGAVRIEEDARPEDMTHPLR